MKSKIFIGAVFFIIIISLIFSQSSHDTSKQLIPLTISIKENEPKGLKVSDLFDIPENYIKDNGLTKIKKYNNSIIQFLNQLKPVISDRKTKSLIGYWQLKNQNISVQNSTIQSEQVFAFQILTASDNSTLAFTTKSSPLVYLYSDDMDFYFMSPHLGFLKKIIQQNGNLYFYYLNETEWVLDYIHLEGENPYIQTEPN